MVTIWVVAFFDGLNSQIERAVVNANTGYFQVQDPRFAKSTDSTKPLPFTKKEFDLWSQKPVQAVSAELVLDANINTPYGATALFLIGVDPESHEKAFGLSKTIRNGEFLNALEDGQVIIGKELSELFKFKVGDKLVLNYQDQTGSLRSEVLKVKGIFQYGSLAFEKGFIYSNQRTWQKLFLNEDTGSIFYNRIVLITPDLKAADQFEKLTKENGSVLKTWKDLNPEMAVVLDFHEGLVKFFFLIIGITITMTILTPVRMLWQERFGELKMMSIIGVPTSAFWKIGFFEVVQMSLLSGFFSFIVMGAILGIQSFTGIDIRFLNNGNPIERAGIMLPQIIFPEASASQVVVTLVFVVIVLGVSYFWSIGRTLRSLQEMK